MKNAVARIRVQPRLAWVVGIPLALALCMMCSAISMLAIYDYQASRALETLDLRGRYTVRVTYPKALWFESPSQPGRPLTVTVLDPPNGQTQEFNIHLIASSPLVLTDSQGNPLSLDMRLMWDTKAQPTQTVYLKPTFSNGIAPSTLYLWLVFDGYPTRADLPLAIAIEQDLQTAFRFWLLRFTPNLPLVFAFAAGILTLAGIWRELRKTYRDNVARERENQKQERDRLVESAREILSQDPLAGIVRIARLATRANVENFGHSAGSDAEPWGEWQREELKQLCRRIQNNRDYQEKTVAALGDYCRCELFVEADELLDAAVHLFRIRVGTQKHALAESLEAIRIAISPTSATPTAAQQQAALDGMLEPWRAYYQSAADLAGHVILWANKQSPSIDLNAFFREHGEARHLLRTRLLKGKDIAPEFSHIDYAYTDVIPEGSVSLPLFSDWLDAMDLQRNPFGEDTLDFDRILLKGLAAPQQWDIICSKRPLAIYTSDGNPTYARQDAIAGACMLRLEITDVVLSSKLYGKVFPLWLELPLEELEDITHAAYRKEIVKACARAWLEFLAHNPYAFFELEKYQQAVIGSLLEWFAQAPENIINALKSIPNPANAEQNQAAQQALYEYFSKLQGHSIRLPLDALAVRPVEFDSSFLIAVCTDSSLETARAQEQTLAKLARDLANYRVMLKLFTANAEEMALASQRLAWSVEALTQTVGDWVRYANRPELSERRFRDLFDPNEKDSLVGSDESAAQERADGRIAFHARSSPSRLRALGDAMIRYRINNADGFSYPQLTREIFDRVAASFNLS